MVGTDRTTASLLIAAAVIASLCMAASGLYLLFFPVAAAWKLTALATVLLCLAPVPAGAAIILAKAVRNALTDAESFATRDPLTGLYNQHTFWDLLQYETQRSARQQYKFTLLHIDVDNFKLLNDKYGHEVGDRYLKDVAALLKTAVRKGDIPARYAGDNFTAILPVCDEEQAYIVANRIMEFLRTHKMMLTDGTHLQETVSIGVAVFPSHAKDAQDLFLLADSMLAQAKSNGKDHLAFPSDQDNVELIKHLGEKHVMILDALRNNKRRKIVPYFQPIVDVRTKTVLAYEVLTRIDIEGRIIPAAEFIEAAENMGAIGRIDYNLIDQAFAVARERKFTGTLFLNLSPKALIIKEFIPTLRSLFRNFNVEPGAMVFEITERDTVKNIRLIEDFVRRLRNEGYRFAIDDFGSGYSSFQYLKSFPVDYLKVDGEFIKSLPGGKPVEREIVTSIAGMASRLGIKTIAEYVESAEILNEVTSAGIHYAQGYYIQRPSPELHFSSIGSGQTAAAQKAAFHG